MLINFFKIAFRNGWRNKGFSAINILGLSVGMGAAMLILIWAENEMSYDRFHDHAGRTYVMYNRTKMDGRVQAWDNTMMPLGPTLKKDFPEVEDFSRYRNVTFLVTAGEKKLNRQGAFADSGFLKLLTFPMISGNRETALQNPESVVITEDLARSLYGTTEALGKTLRIDSTDYFTVSGVLKSLPNNTALRFDYLLPVAYMRKLNWYSDIWGNLSVRTFVLLKPGTSQAAFDAKIKDIVRKKSNDTDLAGMEEFTQPLTRWHLYSKSENGRLVAGRIEIVRLFLVIAGMILLIACINFMNLSTARSEKRAREVGVRKAVGARRGSLILQFIGESILLSAIAFVLALMLVQLSLGSFGQILGKQFYIDYSNPVYWAFALGFIVLCGILAGSYPAFYLSASDPAQVLKGAFKKTHALVTPRKVLVVLQFTFATVLIIATMVVWDQINYAQNRDAGYDRNNLVYVFTQGDLVSHYDAFKDELLGSGAAISVTKTSGPITQQWGDGWGYSWPGSTEADSKIDFINYGADADFVKTMGATLLQGRDIDIKKFPADTMAMLLNEAAVKAMRVKDPIGLTVSQNGLKYHVVGVIKDFILASPYENIQPMVVVGPSFWFQTVHFKLNPAHSAGENLAVAEKIFKTYNPQYPFEYYFADEFYARKFSDAQRTGRLAALFAGLTIFISCLGLFGLAAYMAESRVKEIGVRKVLGASVTGITILLSKDFLKLVVISLVIATPVAWLTMNNWLQQFTYRRGLSAGLFLLAGLAAIVIALTTVSTQAIRAARANPVKSLRTE